MQSLGYGQSEITMVQFLVKYHLEMEQVAFRRDLNDPSTLDNFISIFPSIKSLDYLYLLSFADLSAVNPHVWTQWKAELLHELYSKSKSMLLDQISGEELISEKSNELYNDKGFSENEPISEHLDLVDDLSYIFHFSKDEITQHFEEIEKGTKVSVFFKENDVFTNITVITKDSNSLLSKLCGALAIQDLNIHDAKIFTRKDGLVIDSFNVSDFRTHNFVSESKYSAIEKSITKTLAGQLNIDKEFEKVKSKWKRIINSNPAAPSNIDVDFEEHNKFTIIDIYASDKIGLLYTITHKMAELGLTVAFAKISTKVDGVLDAFYIQKNNGEKLRKSEYGFISSELKEEIKKI
jgi:[protein-PII] uridylyltransferase